MKVILAVVCLMSAILSIQATTDSGTMEDRIKLRKQLFEDYDKMVLPENTTLKFGMALIKLTAHPEKNVLETDAWFRYVWSDVRLKWDETQTTVKVLRLGVDEVWIPDFVLYNSDNVKEFLPCAKSNILVYPSGELLWVPPCKHRANCDMSDLTDNPKKSIQCEMKFGSWTLDGLSMDVQFYNNTSDVDMSDFSDLTEWRVNKATGKRVVKKYDCCEEPYLSLNYNLEIQKKSIAGKCTA